MTLMNMAQAIELAITQHAQEEERITLINNQVEKLQERTRTTQSASTAIGLGIGLALGGKHPIIHVNQLDAWTQLEQAAHLRARTRSQHACPMVIRAPATNEALFMHTPGLKVVIPATPYEAKGLLKAAMQDPDPVLFLEEASLAQTTKQDVPEHEYEIPLGQAEITQQGEKVTIVTYGALLHDVKKATKDAEIINLRTIYPLDIQTIKNSIQKTGRCIIVHGGPKTGGVGAEIAARIAEEALFELKGPIQRVTKEDVVTPMQARAKHFHPTVKDIQAAIKTALQYA